MRTPPRSAEWYNAHRQDVEETYQQILTQNSAYQRLLARRAELRAVPRTERTREQRNELIRIYNQRVRIEARTLNVVWARISMEERRLSEWQRGYDEGWNAGYDAGRTVAGQGT